MIVGVACMVVFLNVDVHLHYNCRCGLRGGYMEMMNFDHDVMEQLYKLRSVKLCPNTCGQVGHTYGNT